MSKFFLFIVFAISIFVSRAQAYSNGSISLGLGYYSQNFLYATTQSDNGSTSFLGAGYFPALARVEWEFTRDWFFSPQIAYTPIARTIAGNGASTTMLSLVFPVGGVLAGGRESSLDWSAGLGVIQYQTSGKGGIEQLNNGTGSSPFATPGGTSIARTATFNLGTAYNLSVGRLGLDLTFEGLLSQKRTQSLMLSYSYRFFGDKW